MFSIFAARMFEKPALQAHREQVEQERQLELIRELEDEDKVAKGYDEDDDGDEEEEGDDGEDDDDGDSEQGEEEEGVRRSTQPTFC